MADPSSRMSRSAPISVIVVAADSGAHLLDCVERVLTGSTPVELILSDNASSDGSVEAVASRWLDEPRLQILRHASNLGFGAACNRGAARAQGELLVFLNPDCLLEVDSLARVSEVAAGCESLGVLGVSIVSADGVAEPASRRRDPLLRRALMTLSGLSRWSWRWPRFAGVDAATPDLSALQPVDAVSGALMALPRDAYDHLGGFDENYFLHCEDLDLCRRARDAGFEVVCANAIRVVHLKGTSSRARALFVARHKRRGMWRWFVKFDPAARTPVLRWLVWCGLWAHYLARIPLLAWRDLRYRSQR